MEAKEKRNKKPAPQVTSTIQTYLNKCIAWCKSNHATVQGIVAVSIGSILIMFTSEVIAKVALFVLGAILVYYGLEMLGLTQVTHFFDKLVGKVKR